ncbi:MAG: hypothetical protein U9R16_08040 [Campylobacterota bacterium]|nr:hypothetical protein [Campylobacterota bacterium]
MDIVIVILILALIIVGFLIYLNNSKANHKSSIVKKHEIIEQYEDELKTILDKYQNDDKRRVDEKKLFLQKCSSELSRNIFFDPKESKQIIMKLASL